MEYYALQQLGPTLTETVVVLAATYWLIASIASFIVEGWGAVFNMRGRALQYLLTELIQGTLSGKGPGFFGRLGNWFKRNLPGATGDPPGLVSGLFSQGIKPDAGEILGFTQGFFGPELIKGLEQPALSLRGTNEFPSYIPSHTFVAALFDNLLNPRDVTHAVASLLAAAPINSALDEWLSGLNINIAEGVTTPGGSTDAYEALVATIAARLDNISTRQEFDSLVTTIRAAEPSITWLPGPSATADQTAAAIGQEVFGGPNGPLSRFPVSIADREALTVANIRKALLTPGVPDALRDSLLPLTEAAHFDIDDFTRRVQNWFDDSMARASGWFKRRVQLLLLLIGGVTVALFNVDTITITQKLLTDATTREHLANVGGQLVAAGNNLPTAEAFMRTADLVCKTGNDRTQACNVDPAQARLLLPTLLRSPDYLPVIADFDEGLKEPEESARVPAILKRLVDTCNGAAATGALQDACPQIEKAWVATGCATSATSSPTASPDPVALPTPKAVTNQTCPVKIASSISAPSQTAPPSEATSRGPSATPNTAASPDPAASPTSKAATDKTSSVKTVSLNSTSRLATSAQGDQIDITGVHPTFLNNIHNLAAVFFWDEKSAVDIFANKTSGLSEALGDARASVNDQVTKTDAFVNGLPEVGLFDIRLPVIFQWPVTTACPFLQMPVIPAPGQSYLTLLFALLRKLAGLFVSACLVSLGAPFWFQLVQNLVNVRSTGPKPKAADAASYED